MGWGTEYRAPNQNDEDIAMIRYTLSRFGVAFERDYATFEDIPAILKYAKYYRYDIELETIFTPS